MLQKLRISLILAAIVLTTRLWSQTDSNSICLTNKQFDFYAQALVENKGLKQDTVMCAEYVNVQNVIMFNMDEQLTNFQDIIVNQQVMIDMKNKDFANLAVDFIKEKKKIKRWQQTALTFMGVSLALLIVVLIK